MPPVLFPIKYAKTSNNFSAMPLCAMMIPPKINSGIASNGVLFNPPTTLPQLRTVAGAAVLLVVCCAMSSRRRKPHGKIVGLYPDGTVLPVPSTMRCGLPRSGSIRQTADSTTTLCSPLTSRMTCPHRKFTLLGWNWPSVSFQTSRC